MTKKQLNLTIIILTFVYLLLFILNGVPFIFGDGYGYYHAGKSLVDTGSFALSSQPDYLPYAGHAVFEYKGKFVTEYSVGNAVLWIPFLLTARIFDSGTIYTDYYKAFDGHSLADGIAVLVAACVYSLISFFFIYKFLQELGFGVKTAIYSIVAVALSSFLVAYIFQFPAYSHVYEVFAVSGMLYFLVHFGKKFEYKFMAAAGLFAGLLVLTRPIDLVLLIPIFIYLLKYRGLKATGYFVAGAIPMALIFFLYNLISYGSPFTTGYNLGGTSGFDFTKFNLFNLLFSDVRGWFVWSPLMLVGIIGLIAYARRSLPSILLYILPPTFLLAAYTFWTNWWAGDSEGQRFFLVLIPFVALGIAYLAKTFLSNQQKILFTGYKFLCIVLVGYSVLIFFFYRITPTNQLADIFPDLAQSHPEVTPSAEAYTPASLIRYHEKIFADSQTPGEYASKLTQSLNGGRSLILLALGMTDPIVKTKLDGNKIILNIIPSNLNKSVKANVLVAVKKTSDSSFSRAYSFREVDFSKYSTIELDCSTDSCTSNYSNTVEAQPDSSVKYLNMGSYNIGLSSDSSVKLVDYKLFPLSNN